MILFLNEQGSSFSPYQPEWPEHWQSWYVCQHEFEEWEKDDDEVEDVPTLLEVEFGAHRHQLDRGLDGKCCGEKLQRQNRGVYLFSNEMDVKSIFFNSLGDGMDHIDFFQLFDVQRMPNSYNHFFIEKYALHPEPYYCF